MRNIVDYSIIIPSYQSAQTITACLEAVFKQGFDQSFEVIVVDSSTDETPAIIRQKFPQVRLIALPRQTYPGTARNLGIQQAQGSVIVFLDSDCVPASDWLARHVAGHQQGYSIVGGAVINGTPDSRVGWASYISEFREFLPYGQARPVAHIPTCNISYNANIFHQYGGFPDEYYPQEDLIFNWMLSKQGEHILFDPAIQVAHMHRTQLSAFLAHQRRIGQVTAQVLRRTDLPGARLARQKYLALLSLPVLVGVKFVRTLLVFGKWQISSVLRQPIVWLLVAIGLINWLLGFALGLQSPCVSADEIEIAVPLGPEHEPASA